MAKETLSLFELRPGKEILGRFKIVEPTRQNDLAFSFVATELVNENATTSSYDQGCTDGSGFSPSISVSNACWMLMPVT